FGEYRAAIDAVLQRMAAGTAAVSSESNPKLPYEDQGACPFEGCTYRDWSVLADTRLLTDRKDSAEIVTTVKRGETVRGETGVVVTTKVGRVVILRQMKIGRQQITVEPGDRVDLLHYMGEGYWKYSVRGVIDEEFIPDQASCKNNTRLVTECGIQVG